MKLDYSGGLNIITRILIRERQVDQMQEEMGQRKAEWHVLKMEEETISQGMQMAPWT